VHAPTEDKCDYTKDSFYEEQEHVFDQFQKYHLKILVGDFDAKVILRGHWYYIVLNVHAPTEDKCDYTKDSFYEEQEHVFNQFPKYHLKILVGDFDAKVGREDISKQTIGNESVHETRNDNEVRM
jgi:hypothetical protein